MILKENCTRKSASVKVCTKIRLIVCTKEIQTKINEEFKGILHHKNYQQPSKEKLVEKWEKIASKIDTLSKKMFVEKDSIFSKHFILRRIEMTIKHLPPKAINAPTRPPAVFSIRAK